MSDAGWYPDAIIHRVHMRVYRDSAGDGVGDFGGLTERLDHHQELGVIAVWLPQRLDQDAARPVGVVR